MKKTKFFMVFSGIIGTTTGVIISVLILVFLFGTVITLLVPRFLIAKRRPEKGIRVTQNQKIVWGPNNDSNNSSSTSSSNNHLADNKPKTKPINNPPGSDQPMSKVTITLTVAETASSDGISNIPIVIEQNDNISSVVPL